MNETESEQVLSTLKECIHADPNLSFGPVFENTSDGGGIWVRVGKHEAYLGHSFAAAMLTARLSDWWIPERDGKLTTDDRNWFERRATLGDDWEQREIPMFREERRVRLAQNISLATDGDLSDA